MLLLATDTSGKHGSVALARGDQRSFQLIEMVPLEGGTFSAQLVPQIADLLAQHNFSKDQIDGFVVASGPGSFTGLRVGLAAIKALAEVLQRPIAAVSLLEVIALAAKGDGQIFAALDAGRGEAYVGEYEVAGGRAKTIGEQLLNRKEFVAHVRSHPGARAVTPDKGILEWAREAGLLAEEIERPRSDAVARVGLGKMLAGEKVSPEDLDANYIRRSDAEIFSKPGP
ncbi:MAG TPA: tRNA (adenosine(37)-N6)-threonylcarbamoyltransferase complex dimerization subunit type 1 TsaB [Terriglobales bacterium]|nr:tRNA (adenosine(37)-N6)-threonylcarbamoyltransferase complex dimerization subunit type 1 TsaB [Terriglobales bacterium]